MIWLQIPSQPVDRGFLLGVACLGTILYVIGGAVYNLFFHPLRKFPGPAAAKISRLPIIRAQLGGKLYRYLDECHHKYGPIVRVAPDELVTIEPKAWIDLYQRKPQTAKDPFGQLPPLNGADSLFTADDATHKRMRGALVHAFSDKALREQASLVEHYIDQFIDRMTRESRKGAVDLSKFLGYLALDIVSDLSLGESFNGLQGDNEHEWIRGFWIGATFGSIRTSLSRFYPLDMIFGSIFLRLTARQRRRNWDLVTESIDRRLQRSGTTDLRSDFITPVIGNIRDDKVKGLTRKELNTNSLALIIAGCEVGHVALAGTCFYLLKNTTAWGRLQDEVRGKFRSAEDITVASTTDLEYLSAVIQEGLRVYHPTPSHLPRVTPPEGQTVGSYWIPGGISIGVGMQAIQSHAGHWNDPRGFRPERWLPNEHKFYEKRFDTDNKDAFRPFSVGPRNCLGGKLYLAQARVVLSRLAWQYELQVASSTRDDWADQPAYLVLEPRPLFVKVSQK